MFFFRKWLYLWLWPAPCIQTTEPILTKFALNMRGLDQNVRSKVYFENQPLFCPKTPRIINFEYFAKIYKIWSNLGLEVLCNCIYNPNSPLNQNCPKFFITCPFLGGTCKKYVFILTFSSRNKPSYFGQFRTKHEFLNIYMQKKLK